MKRLQRHTCAILISAVTALHACSGISLHAQELTMPERWKTSLVSVPPLFAEDTLVIRILGDIMMHEKQISHACQNGNYDFHSYFSHVADKIMQADLAVANMEFTLAGEPYTGYPSFSAPDSFAGFLADCGFDVFLAANNHIFDKGTLGAERTIGMYRELSGSKGIRFTGIAGDETESDETTPLILRKKGIRIAFLNATYGTNVGLATQWPKTVRLSSESELKKALNKAEDACSDLTIVLPHWGEEYILRHSQAQEKAAGWFAENGADMIIGAHPHVIQDIQILKVGRNGREQSVPVAYSLGNAVSNMSAANTQMGLMATVRVVRESDGDIRTLPLELTYLWCSRPGGYDDGYTVIPVADFIGRRDEWQGKWDYDKMLSTYRYVSRETGIQDKDIKIINE